MIKRYLLSLTAGLFVTTGMLAGQTNTPKNSISEKNPPVDISGQWFLAYQVNTQPPANTNAFTLKRGYLTFRKEFNKTFSVRFTQDITVDSEGEDTGNIEMRLKYLYLQTNLHWIPWLSHSWIEAGMVHRPWLDFEEHINDYRVQAPMFIEANHIINSADFGVNFITLLGGKLTKDQQEKAGSSYPGRYGSFSIGVFNGGGYHALEENPTKTIESRLTLRPFPELVPGLQGSYHFVTGTGNLADNPPFLLNHAAITYESPGFIFVAQGVTGKGNSSGTYYYPDLSPMGFRGISTFAEIFILHKRISLFGEYGFFSQTTDPESFSRKIMGGVSVHFLNDQKILFDTEYFKTPTSQRFIFEVALEIRF